MEPMMTAITSSKTLYDHIRTLGWTVVRRGDGPVAMRHLNNRLVWLDGVVRVSGRGTSLDVSDYVTVEALGPATRKILDQGGRYDHMMPLSSNHGFYLSCLPALTGSDIAGVLDRVLDWANVQGIEAALAACRAPNDHPRAVDHLAALALAGDVDALRAYEQSLRDDASSPFLPYIKVEHVTRAHELAERPH
jgi:hypothetical protein